MYVVVPLCMLECCDTNVCVCIVTHMCTESAHVQCCNAYLYLHVKIKNLRRNTENTADVAMT